MRFLCSGFCHDGTDLWESKLKFMLEMVWYSMVWPGCLLVKRCGGNCACCLHTCSECQCVPSKVTKKYHEVRTSLPFLVFQVGGCVPEYHKAVHQRRLVLKERSSSGKPNKTKPRFTEDFLFLFITLKN